MEMILCAKYRNQPEYPRLKGVKKHTNASLMAGFQEQKDWGIVTICAIMRIFLYNGQVESLRLVDAIFISGKDLT
jgi:hypothetical protein